MRKSLFVLLPVAVAALIGGCGGSGGGVSREIPAISLTRVVAGYVYVENNAGIDAGPSIIIAPSSTAPDGYFKPTAGTISLTVQDGTITRAPAVETFEMATSNEVIATVQSKEATPTVQVSGTGLELSGESKGNLASSNISLGVSANNGTVLGMNIGAPGVYVPGAVASIKMVVKDNSSGSNPFGGPSDILTGGMISGNTYSIASAAFDANGVVVTGASPTVTSDSPTVVVNGSSSLLTPVTGTGAAAGPVNITSTLGTVNASFASSFAYGAVANVTFATSGSPTLLWNVGAAAPATLSYTATITNAFGAPVPATTVSFTGDKVTGNAWNTTSAGTAFSVPSGSSANDGTVAVTLSAPASVNGVLTGSDKAPKGLNTLTATAGSVNGTAQVTITRPLASINIAGPSRVDISTTTASGAFSVTNGVDVDNDTVATPAGTVTWSRVNVAGSGNVGDLDDASPQSTSAASIAGSTGIMTAGSTAGQVTVSATIGSTTSNTLTVEVFGSPTKIKFNPATTATGYTGSKSGVTFSFLDNWGHTIPSGEYSFTKSGTADSLSGAIFTNGAGNSFDITAGSGSGTFNLVVNGTWTGANGGSAVIAKNRTTTIAP